MLLKVYRFNESQEYNCIYIYEICFYYTYRTIVFISKDDGIGKHR